MVFLVKDVGGRGCRDCTRCTESAAMKVAAFPFRFAWWFVTIWNVRLFRRRCPDCGHFMRDHRQH
jgi:ribosomal protein S27AE